LPAGTSLVETAAPAQTLAARIVEQARRGGRARRD
jgi:hypothetical protein